MEKTELSIEKIAQDSLNEILKSSAHVIINYVYPGDEYNPTTTEKIIETYFDVDDNNYKIYFIFEAYEKEKASIRLTLYKFASDGYKPLFHLSNYPKTSNVEISFKDVKKLYDTDFNDFKMEYYINAINEITEFFIK